MVQVGQARGRVLHGRDRHNQERGQLEARARFALVALAALIATLAFLTPPPSARAAAPTLGGAVTCSVSTPCGAVTSGFAPRRIAVDEDTGKVYALDSAHDSIVVFDAAGGYLSTIQGSSTTLGRFEFGTGAPGRLEDDIAIDNSGGPNQGQLYVMSEGASKFDQRFGVFAFRRDGSFYWQSNAGSNQSDFCGIAVDPRNGTPYVNDFTFGTLPLNRDTGAVAGSALYNSTRCESAFDSRGNSYVREYSDGRITRYSAGGGLLGQLDAGANLDQSIDLTNDDIYLSRTTEVAVLDSAGAAVSGTPFAGSDFTDNGLSGYGVAVNATGHRVYVSDTNAGFILIYDTPTHNLDVTVDGGVAGRVDAATGDPNADVIVDCERTSGTCSGTYNDRARVTLTVTATGAQVRWSDNTCSGTRCTVVMDADKAINVTIDLPAPTVSGESSSDLTPTTATTAGSVNPNGSATTCEVESGTTVSYGTRTSVTPAPGSGSSPVAVRAALSSLTPDTLYHWRLSCTSSGGTTNGGDQTFRTPAIPVPTATTGAASGITETTASLAATVNPNGFATTCRFEWGPTAAYGSSVDCAAAPGSGSSAVGVSAALSGLTAGTTYHFRIVATNGGGTTNGADATFTTSPHVVPPPAAARLTINSSSATVRRGKAPIRVTCSGDAGATCRGTITLKARIRRGRRTTTATIGTVTVNLAAGRSATLSVKLSGPAKSALAKRPHKLVATATGLDVTKKITLKQPARRARRRNRRKK